MGYVGLTNVAKGYRHIRTGKEWFIALKAACASFAIVCQGKASPKYFKDRKYKVADGKVVSLSKSTNDLF